MLIVPFGCPSLWEMYGPLAEFLDHYFEEYDLEFAVTKPFNLVFSDKVEGANMLVEDSKRRGADNILYLGPTDVAEPNVLVNHPKDYVGWHLPPRKNGGVSVAYSRWLLREEAEEWFFPSEIAFGLPVPNMNIPKQFLAWLLCFPATHETGHLALSARYGEARSMELDAPPLYRKIRLFDGDYAELVDTQENRAKATYVAQALSK